MGIGYTKDALTGNARATQPLATLATAEHDA